MSDALTKTCPCCGGTGHVLDSAEVGKQQKQFRKDNGITLHELSVQIGLSVGYLSDLENGRPGKPWNEDLISRYSKAVKAARKLKAK